MMASRYYFILILISIHGLVSAQIKLIYYDSVPVINNGLILENPWAGGMNCPQFSAMDLDGDGIKDLITFERNFFGATKTFLNHGSEGQVDYRYAPEYQSRFPLLRNWMLLRDYNCDGKEDIFSSVPAGISVYKNVTEPGHKPSFTLTTPLLQTIGLDGQTSLYVSPPDIPAIVDVDNDGDLDILSFEILGNTVEYHKNLSLENFGDCSQLDFELRNSCWGYFSEDGSDNSVSLFDTCELNVSNPEKNAKHAGSSILALDLNGSGAKDLIIGDLTFNNLVQLTNGGTPTSSGMIDYDTAFPPNTTPVKLTVFPASYYLDVDNDSKKDLLVAPNNPNASENTDNIWFYKNIGDNTIPEFEFQQSNFLQEGMIDCGEHSYAVFFDENNDGLDDIIVGNFGYFISSGVYSSQLLLLRNTGSLDNPSFEVITKDYQQLSLLGLNGMYPAFGDMDNDGDLDMFTGDEDGAIHYFRNDGGAGNPPTFTLSEPNYKDIDVGQSAKPQVIDVNHDGKPDLLLGERSGTINFFQNSGTPENPEFTTEPTSDFFGGIDVMIPCCTGYSTPFMVPDSSGNFLMYVGSEHGTIYLFNDIENNLDGNFNLVDSLYLNAININVFGADINNDGKLEMLGGEEAGGVRLLTYGLPEGMGLDKLKENSLSVEVFPNPAYKSVNLRINDIKKLKTIHVSITNSYGQCIEEFTYTNSIGNETIDLHRLNPGIYFLRVMLGSRSNIVKLVVQ